MSTVLPLRERRRWQIRRELAAAAIRLFDEKGAAATTVEAIVAAAGCSPSTFFRNFPVKEDAAFFDAPDALANLTAAVADRRGDVWSSVRGALIDAAVEFVEAGDELTRTRLRLFHSDPAIAARLAEINSHREAALAALFASELGEGPEAEDEAWIRAGAVITATRVALRSVAQHGGDLAEALTRAFDRVEAGFRAPQRRAHPTPPPSAQRVRRAAGARAR